LEIGIDPEGKREAHAALDALVARAEPGSIVVGASAAGALGRHFDLELLNADHTAERAYRLVSFCLSGCFSKAPWVVYGRGAPAMSEEFARVAASVLD
jgi:hypothetical protein